MIIRRAIIKDVSNIFNLIYPEYWDESIHKGLTVSVETTMETLRRLVTGTVVFLAVDDGKIIGMGNVGYHKSFFVEIEAEVDLFFVAKSHRGTDTARTLIRHILLDALEKGAAFVEAHCSSGISAKNNSLWENLWGKFGFKKLGSTMIGSFN